MSAFLKNLQWQKCIVLYRMEMERLQSAISEGKANKVTKKNKVIRSTEQTVNSLNYDLKTAIAEVGYYHH